MKKYECMMCGWIYDEALGDPDEGIAPGTAWEDIPQSGQDQSSGMSSQAVPGAIPSSGSPKASS